MGKKIGQPFRITQSQLREVAVNIGLSASKIKPCPRPPSVERHTEKNRKSGLQFGANGRLYLRCYWKQQQELLHLSVQRIQAPRASRGFLFAVMG
jgi:hypothetical protein